MPPTLSDADRFSGNDNNNGNDNTKSANSSSFILHVPRSTHNEMVSNNVKRVSRDVPGFSDWRGSSRSKSRVCDDTKEEQEDAAVVVELNFATRCR